MSKENVPETTISTLNLGRNCLLTLTNKHLRGQILRLVEGRNNVRTTIKDQVDVLLSGIAGYSIEHVNKLAKRIAAVIFGILIAGGCYYVDHYVNLNIRGLENLSMWGGIAGAVVAIIGWLCNPDTYAFSLNIMGSNTLIPFVYSQTKVVQAFITKLQNAKIAYDEM